MRDPKLSHDLWSQAVTLLRPPISDLRGAIVLLEKAIASDDRNVPAFHLLAKLSLEAKAYDKVEEYCAQGAAVAETHPDLKILPAQSGEPVHERQADGFNYFLFATALARGDPAKAQTLLEQLKAHWDKYDKGMYQVAWAAYEAHRSKLVPAKAGCAIVFLALGGAIGISLAASL
ncbi:MAG: hypothetical protein HOP28_09625 [Gemmatimonadales bacterium]|nr:hypothetical protein [Gemmatimonadales bacterium]